jgi:hypothetical protein
LDVNDVWSGSGLFVHAITDEVGGSGRGCQGTIAWTNEGPAHIGVGSPGGVCALVAVSTVGPGLALVHKFLQWRCADCQTHLISRLIRSGGSAVVIGASSDHCRRVIGWTSGRRNRSSAPTNIGPSQTTSRRVEGAELSTEARVGPCLALVYMLHKRGGGDGHTHLCVLGIRANGASSPSGGTSTHRCRRRTTRGGEGRTLRCGSGGSLVIVFSISIKGEKGERPRCATRGHNTIIHAPEMGGKENETYRARSGIFGPSILGVGSPGSKARVGAPILRTACIVVRGGGRHTSREDESSSGTSSHTWSSTGGVNDGGGSSDRY